MSEILIAENGVNYLAGGEGSDTYQVDFLQVDQVVINNHDTDNSRDFFKVKWY